METGGRGRTWAFARIGRALRARGRRGETAGTAAAQQDRSEAEVGAVRRLSAGSAAAELERSEAEVGAAGRLTVGHGPSEVRSDEAEDAELDTLRGELVRELGRMAAGESRRSAGE